MHIIDSTNISKNTCRMGDKNVKKGDEAVHAIN